MAVAGAMGYLIDVGREEGKSGKQSATGGDVVALVDELLAAAESAGASDVHFEPTGDGLVVRYRLDGMLSEVEHLPAAIADNVISRLKVLGGLLTYRVDIPQEGRIDGGGASDVLEKRLAVFPTVHGQRAVVRVFYAQRELTELDRLGLPDDILASLKRLAAEGDGMLLLTGPAGAGKSTTLAAMLRHILVTQPGRSIVALEDPVERHIEGVTQVQIPPAGEMTFPVALRSLLRQDPEVLMIGEIRDGETAGIAIDAALTGHLLMSTMHSGTPARAVLRLLEMGVQPYQVTSAVRAVLNQRLLRKLCEACRRETPGGFEPVGCEACFNTGYRGRTLVAELAGMDSAVRGAVLDGADADGLTAAMASAGLARAGAALAEAGVTSRAEVRRVCGADQGES